MLVFYCVLKSSLERKVTETPAVNRRVQKFRSDYNDLRREFEHAKNVAENSVGFESSPR